jgi:hypothetical protein
MDSYGKLFSDETRYNSTLEKNKTEQAMVFEEIQKQQEKLAALKAEEKRVQSERKRVMKSLESRREMWKSNIPRCYCVVYGHCLAACRDPGGLESEMLVRYLTVPPGE